MVDLLLSRGAPIDARNLSGATALYFAALGTAVPLSDWVEITTDAALMMPGAAIVSLASTEIATGVAAGVVAVSATATGAGLGGGNTVTETVAAAASTAVTA